jgi:hypothetical protein
MTERPFHFASSFLAIFAVFALVGCAHNAGFPIGWNSERMDSAGAGESRKSPAQLQLEVMDFSDRFVAATWAALEEMLAVE